ncbi:MAG TPA: murein biosynthesis integral membrane protein MurJ [Planctomycetota bacterium]|jgi:putative peptidoglycan lipid II flippase|nr:murein biosynthesis integral membrane protein MurJ [Planctomycetota bacterium]
MEASEKSARAADVVARHRGLVGRTALISALTLSSRLIGFAREAFSAFLFGDASAVNDAFVTAWRVPNLFRSLLGEGAMSTALQTALTKADAEGSDEAGRRLFLAIARIVGSLLIVLCGVLMLVVYWLPDRMPFTDFAWLGDHPALVRELTVRMLPFVILVCLSAVCSGALNVRGHFLSPSLAPVVMNVWWITALIIVAIHFGWTHSGGDEAAEFQRQAGMARWLASFVLVAGAVLLAVQVPALFSKGLIRGPTASSGAPSIAVPTREVLAILWASAPLALGAAVYQINVMVDGLMAMGLADRGGASVLYYATRIQQFPMSLISIAATSAVFPALTALGHQKALGSVRALHDRTQHAIAFVAIPATVGLLVFAEPIITVVYRHGAFGIEGVHRAAAGLRCLTLAILPAGAAGLVARTFYALGEFKTPVRVSVAMLGANIALNLLFVGVLGMDIDGLALSTAITAWGNLWLLVPGLRGRLGLPPADAAYLPRLLRVLAAAGASTLVARGLFEILRGEGSPALPLLASIGASVGLFAGLAHLLRIPEWEHLVGRLRGGR